MHARPPPLALLRTFEAAARLCSFKLAAAELHVTPAAVSQQIKTLEDRLGVPLFERLTRALRLTPRGAAMLGPVQAGLASLAHAVALAQVRPADSVLALTAPPSFATHWLLPRLPDFDAQHPGIELRLTSSSATVDQLGDRRTLDALQRSAGADCCALAVLYGAGDYPGFVVDLLMTPEHVPVCTPGLLHAQPPMRRPTDLLRLALIHDDTLVGAGGASPAGAAGWDQWMLAAGVTPAAGTAQRPPGRRFSNAVLAIEAALAGQGVALVARALVAGHLAAGTLVVPVDIALPSPCSYWLVGTAVDAERPAVVALRRWLLAQAGPMLALA